MISSPSGLTFFTARVALEGCASLGSSKPRTTLASTTTDPIPSEGPPNRLPRIIQAGRPRSGRADPGRAQAESDLGLQPSRATHRQPGRAPWPKQPLEELPGSSEKPESLHSFALLLLALSKGYGISIP